MNNIETMSEKVTTRTYEKTDDNKLAITDTPTPRVHSLEELHQERNAILAQIKKY